MAVVSFGTIKSLLIFFAPMLFSKGLAWYRGAKAQRQTQSMPIVPLTARSRFAITLLAVAATLFALYTTPILSPENIFTRARSHPSTSTALLFRRLDEVRPLTPHDDLIRAKLESKASRLLYYKYGGDVLASCPFCTSQEPQTYLLYAAPAIALTHLLNAALVGIVTSEPVAGKAGQQWRSLATWVAVGLLAVDGYMLASWDPAGNENARVLSEVYFFHWVVRRCRFLAFAALDLGLAVVLYLSATNRMFVVPATVAEKIDGAAAALSLVQMRIRSANVLKNTIARDGELRAVDANYWAHEGMVMQEAMESEEVMISIRDAVENGRIDPEGMDQAADDFTRRVMGK
ncbi:unnamed protein product [Discula destructiva]